MVDIHPVQADEDGHVQEVGVSVGTSDDGQHIVGDGDAAPQQITPRGGRAVFLLQPAGSEVDRIEIIVSKAEQLGL